MTKPDDYVDQLITQLRNPANDAEANHVRMRDAANLLTVAKTPRPVPMLLWCPECRTRHVDVELATRDHHTHACQCCGHVWRPAIVPTVGVQFLPGFKNEAKP